jgi:glc operon protein GlcG
MTLSERLMRMYSRRCPAAAAGVALLLACGAAQSQLLEKRTLSLDSAKQVAAAAASHARSHNTAVVIAVVDDGGHLIYLERLDNTVAVSASIAPGKARTAAIFKRATSELENTINGGRTALSAVHDYTPLQGGVPIVVGGEVIGAIGVSGANPKLDEDIALAGARSADAFRTAARTATIHEEKR